MKSLLKNNWNRILIPGAQGQLGRALVGLLSPERVIAASRQEMDLSRPSSCIKFLEALRPDVVLNAAAYTRVDLAEAEPELARLVNAETPGLIAQWCAKNDVPMVHFSTDYVFSGEGTIPWLESDLIDPPNVYGRTKAEGEQKITEAGGRYLIFRTSWIYDMQGKNFLRTMLKLGQELEVIKVVSDQVGAPTFAADLAQGALSALEQALGKKNFPSGIYHLCNRGETTWNRFAEAIFAEGSKQGMPLKVKQVEPILSSEFPTPARRPKNSRLNTDKAYNELNVALPDWHDGLRRSMEHGLKVLI